MSEDDINKAETILGYLKRYIDRDPMPPAYMINVIGEAQEWLMEAREALLSGSGLEGQEEPLPSITQKEAGE